MLSPEIKLTHYEVFHLTEITSSLHVIIVEYCINANVGMVPER